MNTDHPSLRVTPAYPPLAKALSALWLAALAFWGARALPAADGASWAAWVIAAVLTAAALACAYWILRSRTWIEDGRLRQSWLWRIKEVELSEITRLKLIHVPRLEWLIGPRLFVRTTFRGVLVFPAADVGILASYAAAVYARAGLAHAR